MKSGDSILLPLGAARSLIISLDYPLDFHDQMLLVLTVKPLFQTRLPYVLE